MLTIEQAKKIQTFLFTNYEIEASIESILASNEIGLAYTTDETTNAEIQVRLIVSNKELVTTISDHAHQRTFQKKEILTEKDLSFIDGWDFDSLIESIYELEDGLDEGFKEIT